MFKENAFIQQNHKAIIILTMAIVLVYILDIIKYNTTIGGVNFKWACSGLLVFGGLIMYELYFAPTRARFTPEGQRGPHPQTIPPGNIQLQIPTRPTIPKVAPRSVLPPRYRQEVARQENKHKSHQPPQEAVSADNGEDDALPEDMANALGLKTMESKKQKEKTAFKNFGLD